MRILKRERVVWGLAAIVSVMVGAVVACSGSSSTPLQTCTSDDTRACVGPGACSGGQTCSGGAWSACDCGGTQDGGADGSAASDSGTEAGPDITPYLKNCPQVAGQAPMVEVPASGGGSFCIDTREVTAAELALVRQQLPNTWSLWCNTAPAPPPKYPADCVSQVRSTGDLPANCVWWCDAESYCSTEGKRLCTESEFASACMPNGIDFPWGEDVDAAVGRCYGIGPQPASKSTCHPNNVQPHFFVKDLASDFSEWTSVPKERATPSPNLGSPICTAATAAAYGREESQKTSFRCCADKK